MVVRAARQSAAEWFQIVAEFNQSGLAAEEFCLQRGYATATFNRWRLRYSKQHDPSRGPVDATRPSFVEAVSSEVGSVTITLNELVQIDCPLSLGIERIARLAKAVAADARV